MGDFENIPGLCVFVLVAFLVHNFKLWHFSKMTLILVISFDICLSLYTIRIKDADSEVTLPGLQSRFCQLVAG